MGKSDTQPLISVIIPVYKVEAYLQKCIDSVLVQTYTNLEVILVDDGSPDNCPAICDSYAKKDSRIKVIHKENGGPGDARNAGLDIALGDWIGFVDSDDWIESDFYEFLVNNIEEDDYLIMCGLQRIDEMGVYGYHRVENGNLNIDDCNFEAILGYFSDSLIGWTPNKLYKKEIVTNLRFEAMSLREDLCFNMDVLNIAKRIHCVNYTGYNYRCSSGSILKTPRYINSEYIDIVERSMRFGISTINKANNRRLYNKIMLPCCLDVLLQDLIRNDRLNSKDIIKCVKRIFDNKELKINLSLKYCENNLQRFFCVLLKINMPKLFYKVIKIWSKI